MDKWEEVFIKKFNSLDLNIGYNILKGGEQKHPMFIEDIRKKVSLKLTGRIFSEEHKKNLSISSKGKIFSEETKHKMRIAKLGSNNPMFGISLNKSKNQYLVS